MFEEEEGFAIEDLVALLDGGVADGLSEFVGFLGMPDFSELLNPAIYLAGVTIAIVASLETFMKPIPSVFKKLTNRLSFAVMCWWVQKRSQSGAMRIRNLLGSSMLVEHMAGVSIMYSVPLRGQAVK